MRTINILIPKRGRIEYLKVCLHYLNTANADRKYDIIVYVVDDTETGYPLPVYDNIQVQQEYLKGDGWFNKSKLLNYGLSKARYDFDHISVVDADMCYTTNFFGAVSASFDNGADYIVSHGYKLTEASSKHVYSLPAIGEIDNYEKEEFKVGPSQISMNRKCLDALKTYFGDKLYDEAYSGWGGEDSDLSLKSKILDRLGKIKKISINSMWYHLYHQQRNITPEESEHYKVTWEYFVKRRGEINARFHTHTNV